jgi:hypothetical protein
MLFPSVVAISVVPLDRVIDTSVPQSTAAIVWEFQVGDPSAFQ